MGHCLFCLGLSFFEFHLTDLSMKRQNFSSGVQEKSVQRPLMSPYVIFKEKVGKSAKTFKLTPFHNFILILVSRYMQMRSKSILLKVG